MKSVIPNAKSMESDTDEDSDDDHINPEVM